MSKAALALAVHDPPGHLADKLDHLLPGLRGRFDPLAVHATTVTHGGTLRPLRSVGVRLAINPADPDAIGRHRRGAVALALEVVAAEHVLYLDVDHALRWLENDAAELDAAVQRVQRSDCTVIGRGPRSMAALPWRLAATEGVVNEVFRLVSGRSWDVGSPWPLPSRRRGYRRRLRRGHHRQRLRLAALLPKSRLHPRLPGGRRPDLQNQPRPRGRRRGPARRGPAEWALRVKLAAQHVEAMRPYMKTL